MPKNPLWEEYTKHHDATGSKLDAAEVFESRRADANDIIKDYLEANKGAGTDKVNEFINMFNQHSPEGHKISYSVLADDKGNVFAKRGGEIAKIYAPESQIDTYDVRRSVSDTSENFIRKIAGEDGKVDVSEQDFIKIVERLNKSGKEISRNDIAQAYGKISEDGEITKSEQKMFDALVSINEDLGYSVIPAIGKTLIYQKDAPQTNKRIDNSTGEVLKDSADSPDLIDRYSLYSRDNDISVLDIPKGKGKPVVER